MTKNTTAAAEIKDDSIINHIRNVKLLQAIHGKKKFFVECYPTDSGAICFPGSNQAVKEIELPNFSLYEEKLGYRWRKEQLTGATAEKGMDDLTEKEFCRMVTQYDGEEVTSLDQLVSVKYTGHELYDFVKHCFAVRQSPSTSTEQGRISGIIKPGERHLPESIVRDLIKHVAGGIQNIDSIMEQVFFQEVQKMKVENISQQGDGC